MSTVYIHLMRLVLRLFYVFPVQKNKCVLTSFNGRLYSCNPKYVAEKLLASGRFEVLFALKDSAQEDLPEGIRRIRYRSPAHFYHLMTAEYVVFNSTGLSCFLPYRKKQMVVQTWHGGYSFKVIGNAFAHDRSRVKKRELAGRSLTYFLSSSRLATEQHSPAMSTPREKFLEIGLPRNDILFEDHTAIRERIFREFDLPREKKLVLYAPTYRDGVGILGMADYSIEAIDDEAVVTALNKRFGGDFVFMYKAHHDMLSTNIGAHSVNASGHSDIQELMCAADVILTDYSSCMADFALQRKPGFLFTPDLAEYRSVHPLSMEPEKWPYPTAGSNRELIHNIETYDEAAGRERIEDFFTRIGNREDGHAADALVAVMDRHTQAHWA